MPTERESANFEGNPLNNLVERLITNPDVIKERIGTFRRLLDGIPHTEIRPLSPKKAFIQAKQWAIHIARAGKLQQPVYILSSAQEPSNQDDSLADILEAVKESKPLFNGLEIPLSEQLDLCLLACLSRCIHQLHRRVDPVSFKDNFNFSHILESINIALSVQSSLFDNLSPKQRLKLIPKRKLTKDENAFVNSSVNRLNEEYANQIDKNHIVLLNLLELAKDGDYMMSENTLLSWLKIAKKTGVPITPELEIYLHLFASVTYSRREMINSFRRQQEFKEGFNGQIEIPTEDTPEGNAYNHLLLAQQFCEGRILLHISEQKIPAETIT